MALILSTDIDDVKVQVFGNYFTFKPGQVKAMDSKVVHFLSTDRADCGFVSLPDSYLDNPSSDENKKMLEEAKAQGRRRIVERLKRVVHNLEVSMQRDLDIAGIKSSSLTFASDGELDAYRKLAKLQASQDEESKKREDEIKKLKEKISGNTERPDPRTIN